ncbi:MAG: hypothetical protein RLY71_383 [Pseudomonadota bacterium]|jgi:dGTPase
MSVWVMRRSILDEDQSHRDPFSRDRARIIHSAFFRRLQGKTQVLGLGESDFYRTRLTHSIEVAQIAGGIVEKFSKSSDLSDCQEVLPSVSLIEAIALAHDIGHPPFGHGGEVALNYSMRTFGGFEGNAQSLRIATKLGEYSQDAGLNLTRRTLLGLLKYPVCYENVVDGSLYDEGAVPINIDSFKPPKCIFDCDADSLKFILEPLADEVSSFTSFESIRGRHAKTKFKAFDTSIMELADDIAYGVHDLEDAIALRLVDERAWREEVHDQINSLESDDSLKNKIDEITRNIFSGENKARKKSIGFLVGYFINSCIIEKRNIFINKFVDAQAKMVDPAKIELGILKNFVIKNVIKTAEVQTLEYKGQQMIVKLFEAISNNPSRLLPKKCYDSYVAGNNNVRVICDYIAGTTDDYATRLYHKIFTPSSGSIFDRL